jgi:hypothetical protein
MAPNPSDIEQKPLNWKVYVLCTIYEKCTYWVQMAARGRDTVCIVSHRATASTKKKMVRNLFKSQAQAIDTRHVVMAGYTCLQAAI